MIPTQSNHQTNILPWNELLMLIFTFILDEQSLDNIDTLMHTCHKWQGIVSSMLADLKLATWTPFNKVKNILYSRNMLLLVTIDPSSDAKDCPQDLLQSLQTRYAWPVQDRPGFEVVAIGVANLGYNMWSIRYSNKFVPNTSHSFSCSLFWLHLYSIHPHTM